MGSHVRVLASVAVGMAGSAALFVLGMVLLTTSRGNPMFFWLSEIVVLVVVWRFILSDLRPRKAEGTTHGDSNALRIVTAISVVAFLALWIFAVAFSDGKVDLVVILAYVLASGVFLFLTSIRNRLTGVNYAVRMPMLAACAVVMIVVGLFYLGGGSL